MTKRIAANQMTKENWNDEDEHEEAGHFEQAATVKLQSREIKKAKRRIEKNGVSSSPFSQFSGFLGANKAPLLSFSFQQDPPASNGKNPVQTKSEMTHSNKPLANFGTLAQTKTKSLSANSEHPKTARESENNDKYLEKLKQLNVSFMSWVQEHMNKNQYCDFTPVCMDYVDHMKKLEHSASSLPFKTLTSDHTHKLQSTSPPSSDTPGKSLQAKSSESSEPRSAVGFSFFAQKDKKKSPSCPTKPFSFSANVTAAKTENKPDANEDDDNYVPPKNDFQLVKEQDAVYSKRCKLFYKKGENYADKGVGTLYLKEDNEKIQLIVRADTSTGLILLNICLSDSLPIQRVGKNNVLIVCIPNPPLDPKAEPAPTPFLFRVKTANDADDLFEKLNQYKTGSQC